MPFTFNGIGTSVCSGRGAVSWGGEKDRDAMECFVVMFLPILPMKSVHTFNWNGNQYRQFDIRMDGELFLRAFALRWLLGAMLVGAGLMLAGLGESKKGGPWQILVGIGIPLLILGGAGLWFLKKSDERNRNIRRVLGPHALGSSDPATWPGRLLDKVGKPREMFGTDSYASAVPARLAAGDFAGAMWAARLCVVCENIQDGEALTDSVLTTPQVQNALEQVRKNPRSWGSVMQSAQPPEPELEGFQQGTQQAMEEGIKEASDRSANNSSRLN